jgi:hypothetical protein
VTDWNKTDPENFMDGTRVGLKICFLFSVAKTSTATISLGTSLIIFYFFQLSFSVDDSSSTYYTTSRA